MQNVARNTESCQKVTEQLVESPSLASRKQRQRKNKASVSEHFDILTFNCHFDTRNDFSESRRTVVFVKMLTGSPFLSSRHFSLARSFFHCFPAFFARLH